MYFDHTYPLFPSPHSLRTPSNACCSHLLLPSLLHPLSLRSSSLTHVEQFVAHIHMGVDHTLEH